MFNNCSEPEEMVYTEQNHLWEEEISASGVVDKY